MRTCHFCQRWFKNKQAVRRHLGYCRDYLNAEHTNPPWTRVPLVQCASCVQNFGADFAARLTHAEMHDALVTYRGCPMCGANWWSRAGWRRVPG